MLNQVVLAVAAIDYGGAFSPERLALAGQMTLIGMAMVFAVLAILMLVLMLFKQIFSKQKMPKESSAVTEVIAESAQVMTAAPAVTQNEELIAVITAAVAAYRAQEGESVDGFRVVSFRRANSPRAWNANK